MTGLAALAGTSQLLPHGSLWALAQETRHPKQPVAPSAQPEATRFLDEMEERGSRYFYERADKTTGLVYDRSSASGEGAAAYGIGHQFPNAASIAASGFGLSALCVAAQRGYVNEAECEARMLAILEFFAHRCQQNHGFFYHYIDIHDGSRIAKFELSPIDTSLLLCGVLHAREFLNSAKAHARRR